MNRHRHRQPCQECGMAFCHGGADCYARLLTPQEDTMYNACPCGRPACPGCVGFRNEYESAVLDRLRRLMTERVTLPESDKPLTISLYSSLRKKILSEGYGIGGPL
jgi:hypothetical protein